MSGSLTPAADRLARFQEAYRNLDLLPHLFAIAAPQPRPVRSGDRSDSSSRGGEGTATGLREKHLLGKKRDRSCFK